MTKPYADRPDNQHDLLENEREETPAERLDRNWSELLQELRVKQTGVQILLGFLLILPFQATFADLPFALLIVYLLAIFFGTIATGLMVAPVTAHRVLFRLHAKDSLVSLGDNLAKAGLVCLALTMGLVVTLTVGTVIGVGVGMLVGAAVLLMFLLLWLVLPLLVLRRHRNEHY